MESREDSDSLRFFSKKEINKIFHQYQKINMTRENFDDHFRINLGKIPLYIFGKREKYLNNYWAKLTGLDLYITATK